MPYGTSGDTSSSEDDDPYEFCISLEKTIQVEENGETIEGFKVILVNTTPNTNYPMEGLAKVLNALTA